MPNDILNDDDELDFTFNCCNYNKVYAKFQKNKTTGTGSYNDRETYLLNRDFNLNETD